MKSCRNCANLTMDSGNTRLECKIDTSRELTLCFDWEHAGKKKGEVLEALLATMVKLQTELGEVRVQLVNILSVKEKE